MFICLTKLFYSIKILLQQGNKIFIEKKRKITIIESVVYRLLFMCLI